MDKHVLDIYGLRQSFMEQDILICFNGPFSHSIIEEIGTAVRRYLETGTDAPTVTDVFAVFIELAQNLQNYTARFRERRDRPGLDAGVLVIGRSETSYVVSAGNTVERADLPDLVARLEELRGLDKAGLKALYKQRLRAERGPDGGAGLGLIDAARRATAPLSWEIRDIDENYGFFSLAVQI